MLFVIMLVAGLALAAYGIIAYRRGLARYKLATSSWRQGLATIDQSWLEQMETSTNDGSTISYRARVAYRYLVDGIEHEGTRPFLCPRVNFASELNGRKWLFGVPAGAQVAVWYDPSRVEDAALELNRPSLSLILILSAVGIGLSALGGFLLLSH